MEKPVGFTPPYLPDTHINKEIIYLDGPITLYNRARSVMSVTVMSARNQQKNIIINL